MILCFDSIIANNEAFPPLRPSGASDAMRNRRTNAENVPGGRRTYQAARGRVFVQQRNHTRARTRNQYTHTHGKLEQWMEPRPSISKTRESKADVCPEGIACFLGKYIHILYIHMYIYECVYLLDLLKNQINTNDVSIHVKTFCTSAPIFSPLRKSCSMLVVC